MPRHLAALACLSVVIASRGTADEAATVGPRTAATQRLTGTLRDPRASLDRQLDAVRKLAAAGAAGAKAWRDELAREMERLTAVADAEPPETAGDREIESLRRQLADLRADPDLTHEKLEKNGLPALDRLRAVCANRDAAVARWRTKQAAAHEQCARLAAVVEACRAAAENDPALAAAGPFDPGPVRDLVSRLAPEESEAVRAENDRIAKTLPPQVAAGTRAVDSVRLLCGLGPLVIDPQLCKAAADHSADMEAHAFFAHDSPLPGKKSPWDRARLAGTTASAENIYQGSSSGPDAVKAWFLSPGHHRNLLGEAHRRQGLGCSGSHWTQLFGD